MNKCVERYWRWRNKGFNPLEAFGIVAAGISVHGTMEDLKKVEEVRWNDSIKILNQTEESNHETA